MEKSNPDITSEKGEVNINSLVTDFCYQEQITNSVIDHSFLNPIDENSSEISSDEEIDLEKRKEMIKKFMSLKINPILDIPLTKNEVKFESKWDLELEPGHQFPKESQITFMGYIYAILEDCAVVQSGRIYDNINQIECPVLDEGPKPIVIFEDFKLFGKVFETFGPIKTPFFRVSILPEHVKSNPEFYEIGKDVYFFTESMPQINMKDLLIKGSDASNKFDEEVHQHEMEFSDDEMEMRFKKKKVEKVSHLDDDILAAERAIFN